MRHLVTLLLLLVLGGSRLLAQYCQPTYTTGPTAGDSIVSIQLANLTAAFPTNPSGYNNYTALATINLTAGQPYTITIVNNPNWTSGVAFWIDYNQNQTFEATEQLGTTTISGGGTGTVSFSVPANALTGNTRLRMVDNFSSIPTGPCVALTFGETEDYTVNIAPPAANDIAIQSLIGFNTQDCAIFGPGVPISVKVANVGLNTSGSIPLSYKIDNGPVQTGTQTALVSAQSDTFTFATLGVFPLPSTFYTLKIWHSSTPDLNPANDTLTVTLLTPIIASAPFFEDFENFTSGSPGSLNDGWTRINPSNTVGWLPDVAGTPSTATGPSDDHTPTGSGIYMFTEVSGGTLGQQYKLFTPCISLSGLATPRLSFWYHMAGVDIGTLQVRVIAAGVNTSVWSLSGPQQPLETSPWLEGIVDLSAYAGQTVQLEFRGICGPSFSGDIGLDDVSIFQPAPIDMGAVTIVSPTTPSCYSASDTVKVRVQNFGTQAINFSTNPVTVNLVVTGANPQTVQATVNTGTLALLATQDISVTGVNLSQVGTSTFKAFTSVTGDPNAFNDSTSGSVLTIPTLTTAFVQDIESGVVGNGSTNPGTLPVGWTRSSTSASVTNPFTWFVQAGLTPTTLTGPTGNHTTGGTKYLYTEASNGATGDVGRLTSPCINLAALTAPKLKFYYHMFGSNMGSLNVDVKVGNVTTNIWTLSGTQQTSEAAAYNEVILDLAPYAGQTVQIIFRAVRGNGISGDMAIDDISLFEPIAFDVRAKNVLLPVQACGLTATETVKVSFLNFGTSNLTNLRGKFSVDGGPFTTLETIPGTYAPGDTGTFTFTATANLGTVGTHIVRVIVTQLTPLDQNALNDTVTKSFFNFGGAISAFPYIENFESGQGPWVSGGTANTWAFGTPAKATIIGAASGTKAWVTGGLTGLYPNNENSFVTGPCFNFTNLVAPVIRLSVWWESEFSWDGAVLQSSINGGQTWQNVGAFGDPNNWYTDNTINGLPGGQQSGWSGRVNSNNGSNGWKTAEHALTGLGGQAGVLLRIAFGADPSVNDDGFAFDDVVIFETPAQEAKMVALTAPADGCGLSTTEAVKVKFKNVGTQPITSINLSYKINNGAPVTATAAPINVAPGDSLTYTFAQTANLATPGAYSFVAWCNLAGDPFAFNDTVSRVVNSIPVISSFPYVQTFESGPGGWTPSGALSSWAFGTPAKATIQGASSGVNAWMTGGLTGQYPASENSRLVGPCFNFSNLASPYIALDIWWESEFSWDGAVLQTSIDGGATWQNVGLLNDPFNWYNDNTINGNPGGQQIGWTGRTESGNGSGGWVTARHPLTGLGGQPGVLVRIGFGADGSIQDDGIAFDNIFIYNQQAADFGVSALVGPFDGICNDPSVPVEVTVTNYGTASQSNIPVTLVVNSVPPQTISGTFPGPLAPNASATFVVGSFNASAGGVFDFDIFTDLGADTTFFNDTLVTDLVVSTTPSSPLAISDTLCSTDSASFFLTASSPGATILWYDALTGGNVVAQGDTFITAVSATNLQYYVQAVVNPIVTPDFTPLSNTIGAGAFSTLYTDGMKFNVQRTLTLKSVRIFPNGGGNVIVNLRVGTTTAPTILADTFAIPVGVSDTVLTLNWVINPGSNYVINATGTTLTGAITGTNGLYRNSGGMVYPYQIPNAISVNSSANNSTFLYYFFYDWQIEALSCPSPIVPIQGIFLDPVAVDLGPDGTQCSGFVLDAFDPSITSYVWNNDPAIISPTFTVSQTGIYTVQVTNIDGCTDADTVVLLITPSPSVDLGSDSSACNSIVLDAGNPGALYNWSNGFTAQAVTVSQSGSYSVVVTALGCTATDTVNVTILPAPAVELGQNQISCDPVTLNAGAGAGATYLWSTGATTPSISVTPSTGGSSIVSVTVTGANGCVSTDNVTINGGTPPVFNLGANVTACDSTLLNVGIPAASYLWSNGAIGQTQFVYASGTYSVTVTDAIGCDATDSVGVTINLTPDALATFENNNFDFTVNFVNQSVPATGATYSWDFGDGSAPSSDVNPVHTYTDPGSFLVILSVSNACGTDKYEFLVGGVSIDNEAFGRSLSIYPNPTDGLFSLLGEDMHAENLSIQVTDARGRVVYERTEENVFGAYRHEMNLSEAAEGVYNVRVSDGVNTTYKRVIRR